MNIQSAQKNNVNFTSVVPLKVFINDLPSTDVNNVKKAVVATTRILTKPINGNQKSLSMIRKFVKNDRDFSYVNGESRSGEVIRNFIKKGEAYLFTGQQAKILNELGKKIGPVKSDGLAQFGTAKTFESTTFAKKYFDKIRDFLSFPKLRVREYINPKTRMYEGEPLELHIHAISKGKMGKPGFKLDIKDIEFKKV